MNLREAYYDLRFETAFLRAKGNEFQTFFERLMGLAYKADFMACRPWGNAGDRKNDGFLKSQRQFFQVYAPNEMKATDIFLWFRIFGELGRLADCAEKTGERLRRMLSG